MGGPVMLPLMLLTLAGVVALAALVVAAGVATIGTIYILISLLAWHIGDSSMEILLHPNVRD